MSSLSLEKFKKSSALLEMREFYPGRLGVAQWLTFKPRRGSFKKILVRRISGIEPINLDPVHAQGYRQHR